MERNKLKARDKHKRIVNGKIGRLTPSRLYNFSLNVKRDYNQWSSFIF